jgi:hypothetical protein
MMTSPLPAENAVKSAGPAAEADAAKEPARRTDRPRIARILRQVGEVMEGLRVVRGMVCGFNWRTKYLERNLGAKCCCLDSRIGLEFALFRSPGVHAWGKERRVVFHSL